VELPLISKSRTWLVTTALLALAFALLAQDWIAGLAVLVLSAGWYYLRSDEGPPVLALAFSTQWLQINSAVFYEALFGRQIDAMRFTHYRPMVLIGLGCLIALLLGLRVGLRWSGGAPLRGRATESAFSLGGLIPTYLLSIPGIAIVEVLAWNMPAFTQPILALSMLRYVLLFLVFRRLVFPEFRLGWFLLVLVGEVLFGLSGFFAGFREPIFFAALAVLERTEIKRTARLKYWIGMAVMATFALFWSLLWTGVKGEYRAQYQDLSQSTLARFELIAELSGRWIESGADAIVYDMDRLVDRMWPMYIPATAVNRAVESGSPALGGELLGGAIMHVITPRFLFPDKPALKSDSEMVREFAGLNVAGDESQTSIAFGYAPELFLDLGVPLMFVPIVLYGCVLGFTYAWLLRMIRYRDVAIATVTVIFWLSLYLFERSLIRTVGTTVTLLTYVGSAGVLFDRYWQGRPRSS
jgi:hypothetical protein